MNLGDGLLFEVENGKPKLILLSHGVEKNPAKQLSNRPRAANILSSRQPSCVEEVKEEERPARQQAGRHRDTKTRVGGAASSNTSNTTLTASKTQEHHKEGSAKVVAKVKLKHSTPVGSLRANGKQAQPQSRGTRAGGQVGLKDTLAGGDAGLKDSVVCLTREQLQQILHTVQTSSNGQQPPEEHRSPATGSDGNQTDSSMKGGGGEVEDDRGGGGGGGGSDAVGGSQDKDNRSSGCPFSWMEERRSDSRAAIDAKKAQWRRELDEQVTLKQQQQRSAPGRLQAEEDSESLFLVQTSISLRDQPAAIRSSLRLGEVTPMEEVLGVERREEQRRRWLEELDRQREDTRERRRREKLLQSQTEDHELWAAHFDSLQRRPVQTSAPPPALSRGSERGDWEPSSSLSLVWDATSSCGAESVGGASIDTTIGYPTRASYLRTMTALLDPAQIEERERRRLKQQEQQRAIEAQVEERRRQRELEEARRRQEEEEEERRVELEREMLERMYEEDTQKSSYQTEQPNKNHDGGRHRGTVESSEVARQHESLEVKGPTSSYKDTAVQTESAPSLLLTVPDVSAQNQPPPPPPPPPPPAPPRSAAPPNSRNRTVRTGKENICLPAERGGGGGGGDPYEAFARTDRNRRDKRRPEWNTQRPSHRFVPASERYPASLQKNRQESRQRRQAELLALQERTCLSRTDPPPPPPQHQEPRLSSNPTQTRTSPTRTVDSVSRGQNSAAISTERGRSPPVPTVQHSVQSQQAASSSTPPPPPPVLEFVPYVRTDEVVNLDPLQPADAPPPSEAPPQSSASPPAPPHRLLHPELLRNAHTHRQQEILRGLAQLRQGLLLKQRELETGLNPLLKRHDYEHRSPSATHRK